MNRNAVCRRYGIAVVIACLFILTLPTQGLADNDSPVQGKRENSLKGGSWSIQFQIEDDIGLKPFNGLIISLKRHLSNRCALRFGFDLDLDFDDDESTITTAVSDTTVVTDQSNTSFNSQQIQLEFAYLFYPRPAANVNMFFGTGPLFRLSRSDRDQSRLRDVSGSILTTESNDFFRSWAVGALTMVGVEWFLKKQFSFHAEYRATVEYGGTKTESTDVITTSVVRRDSRKASGHGWDFDGVEVTLGLSVYF